MYPQQSNAAAVGSLQSTDVWEQWPQGQEKWKVAEGKTRRRKVDVIMGHAANPWPQCGASDHGQQSGSCYPVLGTYKHIP